MNQITPTYLRGSQISPDRHDFLLDKEMTEDPLQMFFDNFSFFFEKKVMILLDLGALIPNLVNDI